MPEFLKENGFYFDAKNVDSISNAIEEMFLNPEKRESMAKRNFEETAIILESLCRKYAYNGYTDSDAPCARPA